MSRGEIHPRSSLCVYPLPANIDALCGGQGHDIMELRCGAGSGKFLPPAGGGFLERLSRLVRAGGDSPRSRSISPGGQDEQSTHDAADQGP